MVIKFTPNEKKLLNLIEQDKMPHHIAIIMDGNGRWAKKYHLPRLAGHREGINTVRRILETVSQLGISTLTLYAFSVENWSRPKKEVTSLMRLLDEYLKRELNSLMDNNISLLTIGNITRLPLYVQDRIKSSVNKLKKNTGTNLVLALNYGGRDEIIRAIRKITEDITLGRVTTNDIDENLMNNYIDTVGLPEVDLIIRTSGENRISNFLLWQSAYAEFWSTTVLWPEFSRLDFLNAIIDFQKRERRFGGITTVHSNKQ